MNKWWTITYYYISGGFCSKVHVNKIDDHFYTKSEVQHYAPKIQSDGTWFHVEEGKK